MAPRTKATTTTSSSSSSGAASAAGSSHARRGAGKVGRKAVDGLSTSNSGGSSGRSVTVALPYETPSQAGQVFVVGDGMAGQLGLGEDKLSRRRFGSVAELAGERVVQIAAGGMHTLALTADGRVFTWGNNDRKALGRPGDGWTPEVTTLPDDVVAAKVTATDTVSLVLTNDGRVYGWGSFRDSTGFIGFAPGVELQETPVEIPFFADKEVVDLTCGANHCIAITRSGDMYGWGSGEVGQLGRRFVRQIDTRIPVLLHLPHRWKARKIFCGRYATFAITPKGDVLASGLNQYGQLGVGDQETRLSWQHVKALSGVKIKQIVGGTHHTLVLTEDGRLLTTGRNDNSQLGRGTETDAEIKLEPVAGELATKTVASVAAGDFFSLAVTTDGMLYTWGYGEMFQLGHGEDKNESTPHSVEAKGTRVIQADGGGQHTVILGVKIEAAPAPNANNNS